MAIWSWVLQQAMRKRLRQFAEDINHPRLAQARRLAAILAAQRDTEFGRGHGFDEILSRHPNPDRDERAADAFADAYRARVPVRPYEGFAPAIERMRRGEHNILVADPVTMYNLTSGTTGVPKRCPITRRFTLEHHHMHLLWMHHFLRDHPRVFNGPVLTIVSPAVSGHAPDGTPEGSSSGRQALDQSWPVRRRQIAPYPAFTLRDHGARQHALLVHALGASLSAAVAVNPSSLVFLGRLLAERAEPLLDDLAAGRLANAPCPPDGFPPADAAVLAELSRRLRPRPRRAKWLRERLRADGRLLPRAAWPDLAAIVTWQGGSAPFYADLARRLWGDAPMRCLGLRASEGTFTIALDDHSAAGVLGVGGAFMEFLPADRPADGPRDNPAPGARTLLAPELRVGERYRLLFTTSGGFYRYDIGDIVEVAGLRGRTPEVAFVHRAGGVLSITGEKVTEAQVVAAMKPLTARWPALAGFAVTLEKPVPAADDPVAHAALAVPRYVLAVEWFNDAAALADGTGAEELARAFDAALAERNGEYADKRADGRLAPPRLLTLAAGSLARQRRAMADAGRPEGQIKPPHLFAPAGPGRAPVLPCPFFSHVEIIR